MVLRQRVGVPDLHTHLWDNDLDHTFHEFEGLAYTDEPVSEGKERRLLIKG
jgi:hypothetical protein